MTTWDDVVRDADTGGDFIKGPEKEEMYETQEPFGIVGVRPKIDTSYGPQTFFTIKRASDPATSRTLAFTWNEYRESVAKSAAEKLEASPDPLGPCFLRKFATKGGNHAWEISGEPLSPPPGKNGNPKSDATPDFLK